MCEKGSSTTANWTRSWSYGRRTSPESFSPAACSQTGVRGRTRGDVRVAREDLAAAAERLIAMSGQFEQRRLARPAYQLDVLDAFVGDEQAAPQARGAGGVARADGGAQAPGRDPA